MDMFTQREYGSLTISERDFVRPMERFTADIQDLLMDALKIKVDDTRMWYFGNPVMWAEWTLYIVSDMFDKQFGISVRIDPRAIERDGLRYQEYLFNDLGHKYLKLVWEHRR